MANIEILAPKIAQWEGGYVNDINDKGGATNMGVTLSTWQQVGYDKNHDDHIDAMDIKLLTPEDFKFVLKKYWDSWKADQIVNQSIANLLVDWVWGSGKWGIIQPQRLLGVTPDGIVGDQTIAALNKMDQANIFTQIFNARVKFLQQIVINDPSQNKFLRGWMSRLNSYTFSK